MSSSSASVGEEPTTVTPDATQIKSQNPLPEAHPSKRNVKLSELNFNNSALHKLPIDPEPENYVRRNVYGACFSRVMPTRINNPKLVSYSPEALQLLDLDPSEVSTKEFLHTFAGNLVLDGSEPAAHCYCGHQFGSFAGQLGDGRAMYLGEIVNSKNERWEMQLKGAGKTPYSRDADGRAVLRSSIREFLCSEALYYLGIPTTRAGTLITSDSVVVRDLKYNGNPIEEKVTVVLRLAPTFIRFGSFQIANQEDPTTGRAGPSPGRYDLIQKLLDYTIETHYSEIWKKYDKPETRYAEFFREVVLRTAKLVAEWQCVGFAHGVLNTDNMSILGLTIDFGPFGFLDYYDPDFICNGSDHEGRYAFQNQPSVCKWNLQKLAEAIAKFLPLSESKSLLNLYEPEQRRRFMERMRFKLGLIDQEVEEDTNLVKTLLEVMHKTSADYTNVMRSLSKMTITTDTHPDMDAEFPDMLKQDRALMDYIVTQTESASAFAKRHAPRIPLDKLKMLARLAQQNPSFLYMMGQSPETLVAEFQRYEAYEELTSVTDEDKRRGDVKEWKEWLTTYRARIQKIPQNLPADEILLKTQQKRVDVMNSNNPKIILRNYMAQDAIALAEKGDYSEVNNLLALLKDPYNEASEVTQKYVAKIPDWASEICVTCSS